jgi:hypothetical protein
MANPKIRTVFCCVLLGILCVEESFHNQIVEVPSTINTSTCIDYSVKHRTPEESDKVFQTWEANKDFVSLHMLTFIEPGGLKLHATNIDKLERNGVPGIIIECGVAKAGSALLFATVKNRCRELHLHDTYEGIPQPSDRDGKDVHERYEAIQAAKQKCQQRQSDCDKNYYGNMENLLEFDKRQFHELGFNLQEHSIHFHKGLFDDTVWPMGPVAYAHLDGDWVSNCHVCTWKQMDLPLTSISFVLSLACFSLQQYDSTKNMLERIAPYLSIGGYFVLDDVFAWSGARDAFSDFFGVDVEWLKQQPNKSCYAEKAGKPFKVFLVERASAQVLASKHPSLIPCVKKDSS